MIQTASNAKLISSKGAISLLGLGLLGLAAAGCEHSSPPANLAVPENPTLPSPRYTGDYPKPLPDQTSDVNLPPPAFDDPPLVDQRLPEESWFVSSYNRVGHPRIAIFVNRTLDGSLVGNGDVPVSTTDTVRHATGGVEVDHGESHSQSDPYHTESHSQDDHFHSSGPAEYHETTTVYLHPGQYDEAALQALDYSEMESLLTDWVGSNGQVTLISPGFIRSHLSDQQVRDLQSGKPAGLSDLSQATQADVLIQIQAHPVKRGNNLAVLLVGEAVNVSHGESIGQASVEMPTPIDRYTLNNYTRFLARKLMHGMIGAWSNAPAPGNPPPGQTGPGSPPPAPRSDLGPAPAPIEPPPVLPPGSTPPPGQPPIAPNPPINPPPVLPPPANPPTTQERPLPVPATLPMPSTLPTTLPS